MQLINLITFSALAISASATPIPDGDFFPSDPSPIPTLSLCPAPKYCPQSFLPTPQCGSDGKTYNSNCDLQKAVCEDPHGTLRHQYEGKCNPDDFTPCPQYCPAYFVADPSCGSDGVTYSSDCDFRKAQCKNKKLVMVSRGQCPPKHAPPSCPAPKICPAYFADASICAYDGKTTKTFESPCALQQAQCNNKSKFVYAYDGACTDPKLCDRIRCSHEYQPVCGSNGKTYTNRCLLITASCQEISLGFAHDGEC
ncbi:hypothetical protein HDU97_007788 [Phlyctochytrium planicorne]|nr:hypothetical protein HDU97_007788 [Phlyctochytrium planicorne]